MSDYYNEVTRDYRSVNNAAAHREWFERTEPEGAGEPTHHRITSTDRLELIMGHMLGALQGDVITNAVYAWKYGTPMPARENLVQPLADEGP